jgi:hypothetical protein
LRLLLSTSRASRTAHHGVVSESGCGDGCQMPGLGPPAMGPRGWGRGEMATPRAWETERPRCQVIGARDLVCRALDLAIAVVVLWDASQAPSTRRKARDS